MPIEDKDESFGKDDAELPGEYQGMNKQGIYILFFIN